MAEYERERRVTERYDRDAEQTRPVEPVHYRRTEVERGDEAPGTYNRVEREVYADSVDDRLRRRILYNKIATVIWTITGVIEALIGLRVLLKLIAANPGNGFVSFIYDLSGVFVAPFLGIVRDPRSGNAVLEINSLIAMVVYLLLTYLVLRLIWVLFDVTEPADSV